MAHQK